MSSIKLSPNASGTGALTIAAPNTNTDVTFNLGTALGNNGASALVSTDNAGNLGLGVTPSAWASTRKALQLPGGALIQGRTDTNQTLVGNNWYHDGSFKYTANGFATNYEQAVGGHFWYTAPSGTAGNAISFTQAMTLDASGYLLVGATSSLGAGQSRFQLGSASSATSGSLLKSTNSALGFYASSTSSSYMTWASGTFMAFGEAPDNLGSFTERARIDSSGNLLVGTTSSSSLHNTLNTGFQYFPGSWLSISASNEPVLLTIQNSTAFTRFYFRNTGQVGSISYNGSGVNYNTTSDYRLKEDVQPMTGALEKVAALKPCTYKWKTTGEQVEGFIAHELFEVCPQAVSGEKDAVDAEGKPVYQGIDTSFLVATLTAAIQEQQAMIQALTERVALLEAK